MKISNHMHFAPKSRQVSPFSKRNSKGQLIHRVSPALSQSKSGIEAIAGFVFEKHPQYKGYIEDHFNLSSYLVRKALANHGVDVFFNGGVALVDAERWRKDNLTAQAERIITENLRGAYHDERVGDQGTFFVLLQGRMAFLDGRWNMRRLPTKTMLMLGRGVTGELPISHVCLPAYGSGRALVRDHLHTPRIVSPNMSYPSFTSYSALYSLH